MKKLITLPLALVILLACHEKENEVKEAQRLPEDTINLVETMNSSDPILVKERLDTWLHFYPGEVNRVFPSEATTALGLVAAKYFQADDRKPWLNLIDDLLNRGANPNIFFNEHGSRLGILHAAAQRSDTTLVTHLIARLGTMDPPLRLNCDVTREPSDRSGILRLNMNLQEEKTGRTPLHYAVQVEQPQQDFIEYLLLQGANPDIQDEALQLVSPFQLATAHPDLAAIFQRYSGPQIRYDARLNSFINDEIEKAPEQRKTILDLARAYHEMVQKEGFQNVQDINRVITLCKTGEEANLLGYAIQYLFPAVSTKVAQAVKARNDSIQVWMKDYGAKICLDDKLSIKDAEAKVRSVSLKDFFKDALAQHIQVAAAPVKNMNKSLWCSIIRTQAVADGCWDPTADDTLTADLVCSP